MTGGARSQAETAQQEQGDGIGESRGQGRHHHDRAGEFGIPFHLVGHDVGGGGGRSAGEQHPDGQINPGDPQGAQQKRGHQGEPDQLDASGKTCPHQVPLEPLQGEAAADGDQRQGQGHAGGDVQAAIEQHRHRQFGEAPDNTGKGGDNQRVVGQLPHPEGLALNLAVTTVGEQQGQNGKEVEHRHQKSHQDPGPGQAGLAVGIQDNGQADVSQVAAEGPLAEGADGLRGVTAPAGVAEGEGKADGNDRRRAQDQGGIEVGQEIGSADFVKQQQGEADIIDQAIGLEQESMVDQLPALQAVAKGDDDEDRQDNGQNVEKQQHEALGLRGMWRSAYSSLLITVQYFSVTAFSIRSHLLEFECNRECSLLPPSPLIGSERGVSLSVVPRKRLEWGAAMVY